MNRLSKYVIWAVLIPALLSVVSCTDDRLFEEQDAPNGVDRDKMVEVTIPFSIGKGIKTNITTRSTADTDSQLSGIMVFVYENDDNKPASEKKRVAWQLFSNPAAGDLEHSSGGWIPDGDDPSCGKIKFHVPVGDCYIYLIGNASGTFLEFFPGIGTPGGNGEDPLATLQGFWDKGTPKWTENMDIVDGYLPLVGTVNNERGDCHVDENGNITFTDKDGNEHTISPNSTDESDDNSFVLKRLMSKVTVNIESSEGVTFTPKDYRFRHVATYVSPIDAAWTDDQKDRIPVTDTEVVPFSAQSPNSFTVYLPENVRTATKEIKDFAEREAIVKENGKNKLETEEGHEEHYQFQNAPKNSTYMEITGRFEGQKDGTILSADCRYFIHLGDFGEGDKGYQDFSLRRDHHYTYNINVKGVNKIEVEVEGGDEAPGAEGIVFEGGARVQLDAHYEQVEMRFDKSKLDNGIYIYATTPYGNIACLYHPKTSNQEGTIVGDNYTRQYVTDYTSWLKFRKQEHRNSLALYNPAEVKDILSALDEFYTGDKETAYYTCFVDEYYYEKHPDTRLGSTQIHLSDFINADDRTFSLGSQLKYSADGKSAVSQAVYVLQQRAIACFYDLKDETRNKYGVEIVDEIGQLLKKPLFYGNPSGSSGSSMKDGLKNTKDEIENNDGVVDWTKNGFLLDENDASLQPSKERLKTENAYQACLTRNRDLSGDGFLTDDEIRWYNPARDQVLGLWIGEPAMPTEAALYPKSTTSLVAPETGSAWPIFTSTGGTSRVIYGEQGSAFGDVGSAPTGGYVRAVRNLGSGRPSADSYDSQPENYYYYNPDDRTITLYLTDNALRAFSSRELAPHDERSAVNRPYKKFQVAKHPYVTSATATCNGHVLGPGEGTNSYNKLETRGGTDAKNAVTTIAAQYPGDGEKPVTTAAWRLPNQREMALMVVAMEGGMYDHIDDNNGQTGFRATNAHCDGADWGRHKWGYDINYILHCRTGFSKEGYTPYGYMYNTRDKQMQMLWKYPSGGKTDLGQGEEGYGGYLCVRDVPN